MVGIHPFLITYTCYWHHEWEKCGVCGGWDKPDNPESLFHRHHDEAVEAHRRTHHPRHEEMIAPALSQTAAVPPDG